MEISPKYKKKKKQTSHEKENRATVQKKKTEK